MIPDEPDDKEFDLDGLRDLLRVQYRRCPASQRDDFVRVLIEVADAIKARSEASSRLDRLKIAAAQAGAPPKKPDPYGSGFEDDDPMAAGLEMQRMLTEMDSRREQRDAEEAQQRRDAIKEAARKVESKEQMLRDLGEL